MIIATLMTAAMALGAGLSGAPVAARAPQTDLSPQTSRQLVICSRDEASRRAFKREYGEVRYVSARDVVDNRNEGSRWSGPRCITPTEYQRLESMVGELRWIDQSGR